MTKGIAILMMAFCLGACRSSEQECREDWHNLKVVLPTLDSDASILERAFQSGTPADQRDAAYQVYLNLDRAGELSDWIESEKCWGELKAYDQPLLDTFYPRGENAANMLVFKNFGTEVAARIHKLVERNVYDVNLPDY